MADTHAASGAGTGDLRVLVSQMKLGVSLRAVTAQSVQRWATNFSPRRLQTGSGAHPASYQTATRGSIPRGKASGHEADHSPPSSAKVKNVWSYTSIPPICLHSMVLS